MTAMLRTSNTPNNAINSDSEKRGDEGAPLFTAGYGERFRRRMATIRVRLDSEDQMKRVTGLVRLRG